MVNAGPTLTNAFHVIGTLFPHVYPSGNPTSQMNGLQTWNIPPGDGAMFELQIPDEGVYPFVTHAFAYTGLGSVGADPGQRRSPIGAQLRTRRSRTVLRRRAAGRRRRVDA